MQQEPYQRKFTDPEAAPPRESGAASSGKRGINGTSEGHDGPDGAGKSHRDTAGGAFRRGVERGTAGAVKAVLQGTLTAVIVLAALYFAWQRLPGLLRRRTEITDLMAESRLEAIGEFATYQYTYSGVKEKKEVRTLLDSIPIPGTQNYQKYAYQGTIKVGYPVADIKIHVDSLRHEIYVTLPEASVLSNTIEQDLSVYEQVNNLLNPIRGNAIAEMEEEIKAEELRKATEEGLFELAEEHARELIVELLSAFEGYDVVFW